jgi:hypothetical protein
MQSRFQQEAMRYKLIQSFLHFVRRNLNALLQKPPLRNPQHRVRCIWMSFQIPKNLFCESQQRCNRFWFAALCIDDSRLALLVPPEKSAVAETVKADSLRVFKILCVPTIFARRNSHTERVSTYPGVI